MKFFRLMLALVITSTAAVAQAQSSTDFNDEDLKKYAVTMDSVKGMQQTVVNIITEMVQTNKVMSVARYNELFKFTDNDTKLAELKATPEEIQFLKDVAAKRVEETARINATYQSLAKDYVGLKTFNAIKKSLETDQTVKAKYDTITKELETKGGE